MDHALRHRAQCGDVRAAAVPPIAARGRRRSAAADEPRRVATLRPFARAVVLLFRARSGLFNPYAPLWFQPSGLFHAGHRRDRLAAELDAGGRALRLGLAGRPRRPPRGAAARWPAVLSALFGAGAVAGRARCRCLAAGAGAWLLLFLANGAVIADRRGAAAHSTCTAGGGAATRGATAACACGVRSASSSSVLAVRRACCSAPASAPCRCLALRPVRAARLGRRGACRRPATAGRHGASRRAASGRCCAGPRCAGSSPASCSPCWRTPACMPSSRCICDRRSGYGKPAVGALWARGAWRRRSCSSGWPGGTGSRAVDDYRWLLLAALVSALRFAADGRASATCRRCWCWRS